MEDKTPSGRTMLLFVGQKKIWWILSIGHRLSEESRCGSDLGSKFDEIDSVKEATASQSW